MVLGSPGHRKPLRIALCVLLLFVSVNSFACDPNFVREDFFSFPSHALTPLIMVPFFLQMVSFPSEFRWPQLLETIDLDPEMGPVPYFQGYQAVVSAIFTFVKILGQEVKPLAPTLGRISLALSPARLSLAGNALASGSYRYLAGVVTVSGRARVCFYQSDGSVDYIDEWPLEVSAQIISVWPPVLPPHLKCWGKNWLFDWSLRGEHQE